MFEYTKPEVEVITFLARERIATSEEATGNEFPLTNPDEELSYSEGIGPWD